jgi:diadenosine tetraphosphate (Ap4A) HIT family hydrolase/5-methylcytosine-specific restriction endonuclease McrA
MLLKILRNGGQATKHEIAQEFVLGDAKTIEYYEKKVIHKMPGSRLVRDGLLDKSGDMYYLSGIMCQLTSNQQKEIENILENRINDYLLMRNPFGDKNNEPVPGSLRFEVLREAGNRCELCGVSSALKQIDVDHIIPRSNGGSNDKTNLQALCRTCNAQKKDLDSTDFRCVHSSYGNRDENCLFCQLETSKERHIRLATEYIENELAFSIFDDYPVTEGHTLVIPKRHVSDYFDLYKSEQAAIDELLKSQRANLMSKDDSISGWNVGVNIGSSSGQTIFHTHIHLIPRRENDAKDPKGGVRGVITHKQKY